MGGRERRSPRRSKGSGLPPWNNLLLLAELFTRVEVCIDEHVRRDQRFFNGPRPRYVDLLVIDEADRLSPTALKHLRDRFDRAPLGLLIGMPGIDK